jgi:uncharacterized membrane protein YfcA
MDWITGALMAAVGVLGGVLGSFIGTGGCVIILPSLRFLFGYSVPAAIATNVLVVTITATSGAVAHALIKNIDGRTAKIVAASGAAGAVAGSAIFALLMGHTWLLELILGAAFIYVAVRLVYEGLTRKAAGGAGREVPGSPAAKAVIGFLVGALTGIIGLGGGYALVPIFVYALHAPVKIAAGTSMASFISMAGVSAAIKLWQGLVDVLAAVIVGAGAAAGAQIGARLVPRAPVWTMKLVFGLVFSYVSLKFLLHPFGIAI